MEFKKLFGNMALLGLFVFAFISFVIINQNNNGVADSDKITNNTIINSTYSDLSSNLTNSQTQAQTSSNTFGAITPNQEFGELEVTSVVSPTRIFKTLTIGTFNVLIALPMRVLGVSPIVSAVLSSVLILLIIIGIWAIWKGVVSGA